MDLLDRVHGVALMTNLGDLTRHREITVDTGAGDVRLRSLTWSKVSEFVDLPPADQPPFLISACAVDPEMTPDQVRGLNPGVVLRLLPVCIELNGLDAPD